MEKNFEYLARFTKKLEINSLILTSSGAPGCRLKSGPAAQQLVLWFTFASPTPN